MANRVTMTICGMEYTLVAEEDAAYMEKVGAMVDGEMRQLMDGAHMSRDNAAVLAAVNLADELCKAQENADNLRRQLKTYLDEATAALDSETEAAIQKSFDKLTRGRTTIVIAHRLSTLRNMDRIVVLHHGQVAEVGTHIQLLRRVDGIYKHLWEMQSGGFVPEK